MINIKHVTQDIIDMIPHLAGEGIAVDVGCGDSKHREFIQGFGYVFVGIDLCGDVTIAGDAHKIPIKSNSVDLVFTLTAIEHFSNPFIAMSEMYRILKPGGLIVGSVAFIQPFHDKSYYHCSHFGIQHLLEYAQFKKIQVVPQFDGLYSLAKSAYFLGMPETLYRLIISPVLFLSRLWWEVARVVGKNAGKDRKMILTASTFAFSAVK